MRIHDSRDFIALSVPTEIFERPAPLKFNHKIPKQPEVKPLRGPSVVSELDIPNYHLYGVDQRTWVISRLIGNNRAVHEGRLRKDAFEKFLEVLWKGRAYSVYKCKSLSVEQLLINVIDAFVTGARFPEDELVELNGFMEKVGFEKSRVVLEKLRAQYCFFAHTSRQLLERLGTGATNVSAQVTKLSKDDKVVYAHVGNSISCEGVHPNNEGARVLANRMVDELIRTTDKKTPYQVLMVGLNDLAPTQTKRQVAPNLQQIKKEMLSNFNAKLDVSWGTTPKDLIEVRTSSGIFMVPREAVRKWPNQSHPGIFVFPTKD